MTVCGDGLKLSKGPSRGSRKTLLGGGTSGLPGLARGRSDSAQSKRQKEGGR